MRLHQIRVRRTYMGSSWRRLEMQAKRKPEVERALIDRVVSNGWLSCYFMLWTNIAILCMLSFCFDTIQEDSYAVDRIVLLRLVWDLDGHPGHELISSLFEAIEILGQYPFVRISNEQAFGSRKEWGDVAALWSRRSFVNLASAVSNQRGKTTATAGSSEASGLISCGIRATITPKLLNLANIWLASKFSCCATCNTIFTST